jgi:hypothetical protein
MDAQRFDNLARTLAGRLSRRHALRRAGAAASATLLASAGLRPALAVAQDGDQPVYTVIRRYTLDGSTRDIRAALQRGYVADACKAPGFIAYYAVEDEDGDFATVAVFRSQQDFDNFATAEANWIAQNLGNLLPAPDEAISGDTHVHFGNPRAFPNTCPGAPPAPTAAPGPTNAAPTTGPAPTATPPAPTATPPAPTPTPAPACSTQGCVCATGTRRACDRGLVCCPTTDTPGGPGVCQTKETCHPGGCPENGDACPATCNWNDACPGCCSGYCGGAGQGADTPVVCPEANCACDPNNPNACNQGLTCCATQGGYICLDANQCSGTHCTSDGCVCLTGTQDDCDAGLACCPDTAGSGDSSPGTCMAPSACGATCTRQDCTCNGGVQGNCDAGLVCCQGGQSIPGGAGTCQPETQCQPAPCTSSGCDCFSGTQDNCDSGLICCPGSMGGGNPDGRPGTCMTQTECFPPCTSQGCDCNGGVLGACDQGLVCCQGGQAIPGGAGTCQPEAQCAPPPCTGLGCACNGGVQGNCDAGLVCCQGGQSIPGGAGTCVAETDCAPPPCTGEGCACNGGVDGACDAGLVCCQFDASVPGGAGTCQPADVCGPPPPPPCGDNGAGCDASCAWGDSCDACCSGYCNVNGVCDNPPPPPCTGEGCACTTGTEAPCDGDLLCCGTSDVPGGPGVCQASC